MALQLSPKKRAFTLPASLRPLARKHFCALWLGAVLSSVGFWIQVVGQGWQVLQMTNSALLLGLVTVASTVPNLVFSLFGGVITDRLNRRPLLILTQFLFLVMALLPGVLTSLHVITVWHIILIALMNGLITTLNMPAWQSFIGDLLPVEELPQGIALNSMQFNLSRVIGPMIASIAISLVGIAGSYYLNALSYCGTLLPLVFMHPEVQPRAQRVIQQSVWQNMHEGLAYIRKRTDLQFIFFILFAAAFLIFTYNTFLPVFAEDVFHAGANGLGVLNTAAGIGSLFGSVALLIVSQKKKITLTLLLILVLLCSLSCLLFALMDNLSLAFVLLILLSATGVMASTMTGTMVQVLVPEEMCGRILSIWILIVMGIAPFGNLLEGWIAEQIGAPLTLFIDGIVCIGVVLIACGLRALYRKKSSVIL